MSKTLVLAEKPSVGKELARVLKCNQNKGSYIEGNKYIVTWAMGHLVGLMDPEGYDEKYKKWSMETLPMLLRPIRLANRHFLDFLEKLPFVVDGNRKPL